MSDSSESLPSEIENEATKVQEELIPVKSREKYSVAFNKYKKWCFDMGTHDLANEKVLMAYFSTLSKERKPSSLWTYYSMLRGMLLLFNDVDISKCRNLVAFLKRKSEGFKPKKSKTFEKSDITKFLLEASDDEFLLEKVAFIIGLSGACRKQELTELTTDDVKDKGEYFHFYLRNGNTKTKGSRDFVVTPGDVEGVNLVKLIRKYCKLRPQNIYHNRFFVQFKYGTCTKQPVGINSFSSLPRKIATLLQLESPDLYTAFSFRRSSTSLLADSGADILTVQRQGGWKYNTIAEGYIDSSMKNNCKTSTETFKISSLENNIKASCGFGNASKMKKTSFEPSLEVYSSKLEVGFQMLWSVDDGSSIKHEDELVKEEELTLVDYGREDHPEIDSGSHRPVVPEHANESANSSTSNIGQQLDPFETIMCDDSNTVKIKEEIKEEIMDDEDMTTISPHSQEELDEGVSRLLVQLVDEPVVKRSQSAAKRIKRHCPSQLPSVVPGKRQKNDFMPCEYCPNKYFLKEARLLEHYKLDHPDMTTLDVCGIEKASISIELRRALNFLIYEYLQHLEYRRIADMFADENKDQDFGDWDDVGATYPCPGDLVQLFHQALEHAEHASGKCHISSAVTSQACQASLPSPQEHSYQLQIISLNNDLEELRAKLKELSQQISSLEKEKLALKAHVDRLSTVPPVPTLFDDLGGEPEPTKEKSGLPQQDWRSSSTDKGRVDVSGDVSDILRAGIDTAVRSEHRTESVNDGKGLRPEPDFPRPAQILESAPSPQVPGLQRS